MTMAVMIIMLLTHPSSLLVLPCVLPPPSPPSLRPPCTGYGSDAVLRFCAGSHQMRHRYQYDDCQRSDVVDTWSSMYRISHQYRVESTALRLVILSV